MDPDSLITTVMEAEAAIEGDGIPGELYVDIMTFQPYGYSQ